MRQTFFDLICYWADLYNGEMKSISEVYLICWIYFISKFLL